MSEPDPVDLDRLLAAANFVWRVSADGTSLERRVDPTATEAYRSTVRTSPAAAAAAYLQTAWENAFGRNPDPDKAYDHAVLAVEELLAPLVLPVDGTRTLGKANARLKTHGHEWQLNFGDATGAPAPIDTLLAMSSLLWRGQSRHAGSPTSRSQTQTEAEAAVYLSVTMVQWLSTGVLQPRP